MAQCELSPYLAMMTNLGRRATPNELKAWQLRLAGWRTPAQFGRSVQAMRRIFYDHTIDQPGSCFRDAYTALIAAERSKAEWLRLGDDPPDFELIRNGKQMRFEAVEVQAPNRRRGAELKVDRNLSLEERLASRHLGDDAWIPAVDALKQLNKAVLEKAGHSPPYPSDTILAVYLNPGFVDNSEELVRGIETAIGCGFPSFAEVWILRTTGEVHIFSRNP